MRRLVDKFDKRQHSVAYSVCMGVIIMGVRRLCLYDGKYGTCVFMCVCVCLCELRDVVVQDHTLALICALCVAVLPVINVS